MSVNQKPRRRRWIIGLIVVAVVAAAGYFVLTRLGILGQGNAGASRSNATGAAGAAANGELQTVAIQPATLAQGAVSASGQLSLVDVRSVPLAVSGIVQEIDAAVGDPVSAGAVLLKLDTTDLEQAVEQAQLNVESAKIALADLQVAPTSADLAQAQAALVEAQQNLESVKAGPTADEIAAARSSLAAAQASYDELAAGASQDQLTQLSADLKKKEIALQDAQRAYDQVAWRGGSSAEAVALQSATIDYEAAKAAYGETTAPPSTSQDQTALSSIQNARSQLNDLLNTPTEAQIAAAEAQVAQAQATLTDLQTGPTDNAVRSAEITLQKALIDLANANRDLVAATVTSPIAGVLMSLNAELGVRQGADSIVATIADPRQLELIVDVAESDMPSVALNQPAQVEIDALPGKTFSGTVQRIAPVNTTGSSSVSYPVTIRLTDSELDGVLPGMNAVATLESRTNSENSWLVPTNALREENGSAVVMVVRDGVPVPVAVTRGAVQAEWTVVQSPELQAGDEVVGTVTSRLNEQRGGFFGGPPPGGIPGAAASGAPEIVQTTSRLPEQFTESIMSSADINPETATPPPPRRNGLVVLLVIAVIALIGVNGWMGYQTWQLNQTLAQFAAQRGAAAFANGAFPADGVADAGAQGQRVAGFGRQRGQAAAGAATEDAAGGATEGAAATESGCGKRPGWGACCRRNSWKAWRCSRRQCTR